ncbi:MAG TPA: hypothetical protein PK275_00795 [Chitinophagaceae bacterium]|jgi:hypothetical protein|nr:hypothetical protein [Chitinophagaceae bacterium]
MFETELEMSLRFEKYLKSNFGNTYLKEHPGLFGVPDFVFYAKKKNNFAFVSFELKLKNWKRAAKQAFRYKSFSNVSYVVLGSNYANAALNNLDFFKQYNIGLATFDSENYFEIHFKPEANEPYSENLKQKLVDTVAGSRKKTKKIKPLLG